ncbi:neurexin protein binding [Homalodisca vitripennis]|nr:neurexin protein binding [Homalodisca vitripennis]
MIKCRNKHNQLYNNQFIFKKCKPTIDVIVSLADMIVEGLEGRKSAKLGTAHGEKLPYFFGAPLVDGFSHFLKNYTKTEVAVSESVIIYLSNFVRSGMSTDNHDSRFQEYEFDSVGVLTLL